MRPGILRKVVSKANIGSVLYDWLRQKFVSTGEAECVPSYQPLAHAELTL
ncbi:MAG: hypothetical protein WCH39_27370 [Schlesneria sp.]